MSVPGIELLLCLWQCDDDVLQLGFRIDHLVIIGSVGYKLTKTDRHSIVQLIELGRNAVH